MIIRMTPRVSLNIIKTLKVKDIGMEKPTYYTVAVGGSAGSLKSIVKFVRSFPKDIGATFFVILHRPSDKKSNLQSILDLNTDLNVNLVEGGDHLECATIYINRPSEVIKMNKDDEVKSYFKFDPRTKSINELFSSLAENVKEKAIGVIFSGVLDDGSEGLKQIKKYGGKAIVQSPDEAPFKSMPISAIKSTDIDFIGKVEDIVEYLKDLLKDSVCER